MDRRTFLVSLFALYACGARGAEGPAPEPAVKDLPTDPETVEKIARSDADWKALLPAESYHVMRKAGTERAFTGRYWNTHSRGTYVCAACGLALFSSGSKFDSGTGWPSFTQPLKPDRVTEHSDATLGMVRTEATCARCGGHLGHVFDDGPAPTGLRYCMNSAALVLKEGS